MRKVYQEFLHDPDNGVIGDCQRACVASILELNIKYVPHFGISKDGSAATDDEFNKALNRYMACFDLCLVSSSFESREAATEHFSKMSELGVPDIYHLIHIPSPRSHDVLHSVVGCNGNIVHDPHPDNEILAGSENEWAYVFLVSLCSPGGIKRGKPV